MEEDDNGSELSISVVDDAIIVTMPGTSYSVSYHKRMTHGSSRQTFATTRTLPSTDGHFAPEPGPQPVTRRASLGGLSSAFHYAAWQSFELWAIMTRGGYRE